MISKLISLLSISLGVVIKMSIKIATDSTPCSSVNIKPKLEMHFGEMELELIRHYRGDLVGLCAFYRV
jgi:hypothetical protein